MKSILNIFKNFFKHECPYLATHISFCALLSIVPMLLISFAIVGTVLGSSEDIYQQLVATTIDLIPKGRDFLTQTLNGIVGERHSFGILGLVILIGIATLLFGAVERSLDIIFEAECRRNFFHSRLLSILLIVIISVLFFMPTAADLLTRALEQFGFHFPLGEILRGKVFFLLFSFLSFLLLILIIPHHRVRARYAMAGGIFFAVAIFTAKLIFRWYMLKVFVHYNVIYGSLTAFVLLLIWIFYAANIFLFAAEIVACYQLRHARSCAVPPSDVYKSHDKHSV
ncbi:MAG: YihY/virulence factor BrkB family protein [Deltaproteobacteria bacterium]|nr:YihY/virulence factor BrkB family protein [Deltaproteobacteria bacterium]